MPLLLLQSVVSNAIDVGDAVLALFLVVKSKRLLILLIITYYYVNLKIMVLGALS